MTPRIKHGAHTDIVCVASVYCIEVIYVCKLAKARYKLYLDT
jgi:hypothetical protein